MERAWYVVTLIGGAEELLDAADIHHAWQRAREEYGALRVLAIRRAAAA